MALAEPTTSFFGRDAELEQLRALFDDGRRLVTVLGPGGVGKTRLALRFAALASDTNAAARQGVFCADLTEATSLGELCAGLSRALGVVLGSTDGDSGVTQLARTLGARGRVLLVLDNLEQLVGCAAPALAALLAIAPDLHVLATSRVRLRASGETVLDLEPLQVPGPGDADPDRYPAVQLFVERARRIAPGWGQAPGDAARVADIVRRLDGLPLALELCATRGRALDPASLLQRLERGFDALGTGPRDVAARHTTLAHAIEWSVRSLAPAERSAFEQCAVFSGGFDLEAAEAVIELDGALPVLDALSNLVDGSLLRAKAGRFSMYAVIREHAGRALADRDVERTAEARHARYYLDLGERLFARSQDAERSLLAREQDNLAAVHARAIDSKGGSVAVLLARPPIAGAADPARVVVALRSALVLDELLEMRGTYRDAFERIDLALRAGEQTGAPAPLLARARWARGRAQLIARTADAIRDLELAVAQASEIGDRATEARACATLGVAYRIVRRIEDARAMGERSIAVCRELDAPRIEARARNALGGLLYEIGEHERASVLLEEAERMARDVGDGWVHGWAVAGRAHLFHERGALGEAADTFERAAALFRAVGDERDEEVCHGYRAAVLHERGDLEVAHRAYVEAADRLAQLGNPRFDGFFRACSGAAAAGLGQLDTARAALDAAERIVGRLGDPALELVVALHRLHLDIAEGRTSEAIAASRALTEKSPLVASSDDVRLALRILHRALATAPRGPAAGGALRLALGPRWFQPPDGKRTPLARKRALWLVLHALADARLRSPGRILGSDELLAAGWPGERILPAAGVHRVRVAVATLRQSGLRDILLSRAGGYLLDPAVRVELFEDGPPADEN